MDNILCSVVVPMYNEEAVVCETYKRLTGVMEKTGYTYEIVFVNDGSRDKTAALINEICDRDKRVKLIDFSRNFGHQIAITAGMDYSSGQCVVVIDGDLQDPPELIPEMIEKWKSGFDVVYGKRISRKGETFFKKFTAAAYYRFLRSMTDVNIPVDTGDFRLIDRKVCDALKQVRERNRYVRGLISWLGFRQTAIEFEREERFAGETKYPLKKMLSFAWDGITSFSVKPLELLGVAGVAITVGSLLISLYSALAHLFGWSFRGWSALMGSLWFIAGMLLTAQGILGAYIGKIYAEVKDRPRYLVETILDE